MIECGQNLRYIVKDGDNLIFSPNCCHKKGDDLNYPVLKEGSNYIKCQKCGTEYKISNPSNMIKDLKVFIVNDKRPEKAIKKFEEQNLKLLKLIQKKEKE